MKKLPFKTSINNEWSHFLQTDEWAYIKEHNTAWKVLKLTSKKSKASIYSYSRSVLGLGAVHYIPKLAKIDEGSVAEFTDTIKASVGKGMCIQLELDQPYSEPLHTELLQSGWLQTTSIQYDETVIVDLTPSTEDIYKSFKKRARWELSAAQRRGAVAKRVECTDENLKILFDMLKITAERGNFSIRTQEFHTTYWKHFAKAGTGHLYFVTHEDDILSAAYIMNVGKRVYYKDGASIRDKSNLFASRLMHWQIIQDTKAEGATAYDMCGVMNSKHIDDKNKGIHTFKTGFAPVVALQSAYTLPLNKPAYKLWAKLETRYVALYFKLKKDLWY